MSMANEEAGVGSGAAAGLKDDTTTTNNTTTTTTNTGRCGFLNDPHSDRWRLLAVILAVLSFLLLVGVATTLAIFLVKTECNPPPRLLNATSTYLGSATPGTQVSFVCQAPLVFPDNTNTFMVTCRSDLQWDVKAIPTCAGQTERKCSYSDDVTDILLSTRSSPDLLEVELTFLGPPPPSLLLDVPAGDHTLCSSFTALQKESVMSHYSFPLEFWKGSDDKYFEDTADENYTVLVTNTEIKSREPYEVRLRSIGARVAVSLLQGEYVKVELFTLDLPPPTSTISNTLSTTINPSTSDNFYTEYTVNSSASDIPSSTETDSSTNTGDYLVTDATSEALFISTDTITDI